MSNFDIANQLMFLKSNLYQLCGYEMISKNCIFSIEDLLFLLTLIL